MPAKSASRVSLIRRLPRIFAIVILLAGALVQTPPSAAQAAPLQAAITVTTTADEYNTNAGACSLREAIQAANTDATFGGCAAGSGADTINLPAGTYQLSLTNADDKNEDYNATGDLDIHATLTLTGAGAATTFIQAGSTNTNGIDKVFGVNPSCNPGVSVAMDGVTIRYGRNTQAFGATDYSYTGGGLDYCTSISGNFSLNNAVVTENTNVNGYGGGLNVDTIDPYNGTITISNTTFSNNHTLSTTNLANGAGAYIWAGSPTVMITNSTFTGNTTAATGSASGAGLYFDPRVGGSLSITNTTFDGNAAAYNGSGSGGGAYLDITGVSSVTIADSDITNNHAKDGGGLEVVSASATGANLSNLLIANNQAASSGGGLYIAGPNATIQYSRIVGNTASSGTGLYKGTTTGSVTAANNWWGCSTGPGAAPCNTAFLAADATGLVSTPWLRNQLTSNAGATLGTNQTTTLTSSFLTNSAGGAVAPANLGRLIGQPVTWNASTGALSGQQTTIQAAGTATASFQATAVGSATVYARVDGDNTSGASSNLLSLTVNKANTTASITNSGALSGTPSLPNAPVTVSVGITGQYGNTPTTPTGTVTVSSGTDSCPIVLPAGSCSITFTTPGSKTISVSYSGDGNFNASTASVTHEVVAYPSVTINKAVGQADPTNAGPVNFTVVFSAPMTGFATGDVDLSASTTPGTLTGTVTEIAPNDGTTYTVAVSGMTGSGTVTASIPQGAAQDGSGNSNTASTSTDNAVLYDVTPPAVTINQAGGQADPTNGAVNFTVVFTKPVTGFATGDVDLSTSTVSGTLVGTVTGGPSTYNVAVSGMTGSGTVTASIPAGVAQDSVTNLNTVSSSADPTVSFDAVPPDTSIFTTPANPTSSTSAAFNFSGSDPGGTGVASFQCSLDGAAFSGCSSPQSYSSLSSGSHTFQVKAFDVVGNADSTPASYTWVVDTTGSDTIIDTNPANPTSSTSASFTFHGSDPGGTGVIGFECDLDGGGFAACSSPQAYTGLSDGSHTFQVRSVDAAGNPDPTPASSTWVVDTTRPDTTLTANPSAVTNSTGASFSFTGSDPGGSGVASFQCDLDGSGFSACTSPQTYTDLADGSHTFQVKAVDSAGNADASPASYTWVIDTVSPNTTIETFPVNPTSSSGASFAFSGSDNAGGAGLAGFQCELDGAGFSACASPKSYTGLSDGSHTFQVRSVDAAGNPDPTPASSTWVIDATPPDTVIDSNPANPTSSTSASFSFHGSDGTGTGVAGYSCKLDGGTFSACTSPQSYSGLSGGSHTFSVAAVDTVDNTDPTPASYTWTIDTAAPTVTMSSTAADPTNTSPIPVTVQFSEPVIGFAAGDITPGGAAVDGFTAVDGDTYTFNLIPGGQGLVTAGIAAGAAADASGNASEAAAQFTITYDSVPPSVAIHQAAGQADPAHLSPVLFTVVFSEPVTGFVDGDVTLGGTAGATTAVVSAAAPNDGATYTVAVSGMTAGGTVIAALGPNAAQDAAGNGSAASTSDDNTVSFLFETTTTLDSSVNPTVAGQAVTFTATVTSAGGVPTGSVQFLDGEALLGTVPLDPAGQAAFTTSTLGVGAHSVSVLYLGAEYYPSSASSTVVQTILKANTTTSLMPIPSPSVYGEPVTLSAMVAVVAPGGGIPTGTVEFREGAAVLGTGTLNAGGVASLTTSALQTGTHTVTAVYAGGLSWNGSVGTASHTVNSANTTTILTSGGSPSNYGEPVTFTATVEVVSPGTGTPTGMVEFVSDSTSLGTVPLSGGSAAVTLSTLDVGLHNITAAYLGDSNNRPSASLLPHTVVPGSSTVAVISERNPSVFGEPVTLTATVSGLGLTPTGTVQIFDDGSPLGAPLPLVDGSAALTTSALPVGMHSITVSYSGDVSYLPSASPVLNQIVAGAGTETTLSDAPDPSLASETVTFSYAVSVLPPGAGVPTGNVTVTNGTDSCTGTVAAGSCPIALTATGTTSFTATYAGDSSFSGSTSTPVAHTVNQPPAITSPNNVTFVAGNPSMFAVTTTGVPAPAITLTGTLPTGMTFVDQGDGAATLAGTPALSAVGSYNLTFTASSGVSPDATQAFTLTVEGPPGVSRIDSVASTGGGEIVEDEYTSVSITQLLVVFNKDMNAADASNLSSYSLIRDDSANISIESVVFDPGLDTTTLMINGGAALPNGKYTLTVSGSIEDTLGAPMGADFTRTFFVDQIVPAVSRIDSIAGTGGGELAEDEVTNAGITQLLVIFNEPVNLTSAQAAGNYNLVRDGSTAVVIDSVAYDDAARTASLNVNGGAALANGQYTLTVSGAIDDLAGTPMGADFTRTFSIDQTVPAVSRINSVPDSGDGQIDENEHTNAAIKQLLVVFSKDMDPADAQTLKNYSLVRAGSTVITISSVAFDASTHTAVLSLKKGSSLTSGRYTLTVSGAITDTLGTSIGVDFVRSFYVDQRAPRKVTLQALPNTASLENGATLPSSFSQVQVTFDEDVNNPSGDTQTDDVTNPHNYLLVTPGPNGTFETLSCKAGLAGDDGQIEVGPVTYANHGGAGPFVATVQVNKNVLLDNGSYKFFVCGTTSIVDQAGNPFNDGADEAVAFRILVVSAVQENPQTGFAPGVVTVLPEQPAAKAYHALTDLWIEIPALGLKTTLTGVPLEAEGWDVTWLYGQVGWLEGTAYPTWAGNTVLTAHAYTADGLPGPFSLLKDLRYGDTIVLHAGGMRYTYAVRTSTTVRPTNTSYLTRHEEQDWLTLITCQQYDERSGAYRYRQVVRAVLVQVEAD